MKTCFSIVLHIWLPVPGIAKQLLPPYLFRCLSRDLFCAYLSKQEDLSSFLVLCLYSVVVFSFASHFKADTKENEDNFYSIEWSSGQVVFYAFREECSSDSWKVGENTRATNKLPRM